MTNLPLLTSPVEDCWNRIGVRGDRSCPELAKVVHCHNCPVFTAAGRRFLDAPSPEGYVQEWAQRLAAPVEEPPADLQGVLIFRLAREWLALRVQTLVEVTGPRRVHRVPHRGGVLAGLVNIRGELHPCVRLDQLLGISEKDEGRRTKDEKEGTTGTLAPSSSAPSPFALRPSSFQRLLVVRHDAERWVFPVDEADQVHRFPLAELTRVPATLARALARLTRGLFHHKGRAIGLIDDERLFVTLRGKIR